MMNNVVVLRALLRSELRYFLRKVFCTVSPGQTYLPNWHIEAIVHQLMRVHVGETKRLLITQPPRSLKSIGGSVAYVAWLLGHDPTRKIIVVSYSSELAAELHRQFRMVIDSNWYKALFPGTIAAKDTGLELVTTRGGGRYATSVGGTLTGRGADLIIIDDPLNASEAQSEPARKRVIDWYGGTLVSRLNDKQRGAIIAVMQRLHEQDLAGHLLEQGGWDHLNLPAIALEDEVIELGRGKQHRRRRGDVLHPERENREILDRIKADIGSLRFSAQYQQQPVPLEGNLIKRGWFSIYSELPARGSLGQVVQSWDIAMLTGANNDYSVCTTWQLKENDAYLAHVYRDRLEYPDLRRKVIAMAYEYKATTVLIEDASVGTNLLRDLWRNPSPGMTNPIGRKPEGSKIERMAAASAKIEAGHIYLPQDAPWLDTLLMELLAFPNGRHDDQVDSLSQFLIWLQQHYEPPVELVAPIIVTGPRGEDRFSWVY